jgi:hypothetical protein
MSVRSGPIRSSSLCPWFNILACNGRQLNRLSEFPGPPLPGLIEKSGWHSVVGPVMVKAMKGLKPLITTVVATEPPPCSTPSH